MFAPLLALLVLIALPAWAQSTTPQAQPRQQTVAPPKVPLPAPREPVQTIGKSPPVVQPHGSSHAQKPPANAHKPLPPKSAHSTPAPAAPAVAPPTQAEPAKPPQAPDRGSASGLPLPRFAALRSDEVNLRAGPGTRYPIEWIYKRRDLPVEIDREFEVWRLVKDPDGIKGWVHQATLTGRRSFIVIGGDAALRRDAQDTAAAAAILKPGVIGHIRSCDATTDWCQVQAGDYRGYLKRSQIWGTLPGEAVSN